MSRLIFNLPAFLAAAMLIVPAPVCVCWDVFYSGNACEASECCRDDDARIAHRHDEHSPSSHRPTVAADRCPVPKPCHCTPGDSPAAAVADAVATNSEDWQSAARQGKVQVILHSLSASPERLWRHAGSAGSIPAAGILAGGNPCALLCCWLF